MKFGLRYKALPNPLTAPFADQDPWETKHGCGGLIDIPFEVKENHDLMVEAMFQQARLLSTAFRCLQRR